MKSTKKFYFHFVIKFPMSTGSGANLVPFLFDKFLFKESEKIIKQQPFHDGRIGIKMKVIKTSNQKCSVFVDAKKVFNANNIFSVIDHVRCNMPKSMACLSTDKVLDLKYINCAYVVYSYGYHFPMFVFVDGEWYENSDKYSVSTSKQQTQARPSCKTIKKTTQQLMGIIVGGKQQADLDDKFNNM